MRQGHGQWLIWVSVFIGAVLSVMPLPALLASFRPAWIALLVIFWMLMLPTYLGLFFAWMCGILLDALYGTVFGHHGMAMLFTGVMVAQLEKRLRMSIWWQQSVIVLMIVAIYQLTLLWIGSATGRITPSFVYLWPALSSAIVWPWLAAFLNVTRRRFMEV